MTLTRKQQAELLALGDADYAASLAPDDGRSPDPATVSMPNLKSMSIWDAIADSPAEAEDLQARAELMMAIRDRISEAGWTQSVAAERLGWDQARVADLLQGRISRFELDELGDDVARLG